MARSNKWTCLILTGVISFITKAQAPGLWIWALCCLKTICLKSKYWSPMSDLGERGWLITEVKSFIIPASWLLSWAICCLRQFVWRVSTDRKCQTWVKEAGSNKHISWLITAVKSFILPASWLLSWAICYLRQFVLE